MAKKSGLPKNAKRVFKGVIFDVYQWPQTMFDGSTEIFEKLKRPDTVQVIAITKDKKILILEEQQPTKKPFLGIPGGRHEQKETPLNAAKRELREETGYTANHWRLWYAEQPYSKIIWTISIFIADGINQTTSPMLDAGEKIKVKKLSFNEFILLGLNPDFHEPSLKAKLLEALYNPRAKAKLKKLLFR
ncbi:MAG: NUDIX hydrolase [Candidatus Magasanikbacteria bacterium]|nr:NUDIX hydrolase [Candidatus Magasanikbacteria bacterium]